MRSTTIHQPATCAESWDAMAPTDVGRPLLAAAQPITGRRRWAVAMVLLLWSVVGLKARAQGAKPGATAPKPTHATIPDSLFLVHELVTN